MRIGIDALPLLGNGGVSRYVGPLIRTLVSERQEHSYILLFRLFRQHARFSASGIPSAFSLPHVCLKKVYLPDRVLSLFWERLHLSIPFSSSLVGHSDIFLCTTSLIPTLHKTKIVTVVCDCIPLKCPFYADVPFRTRLERAVRLSSAFVVPSERTRLDLIELFSVPPERITVIYPATVEGMRPISHREMIRSVLRRYIPGDIDRYVLYVGSLGQHKNLHALLQAFHRAKRCHNIPHTLVVASRTADGQTLFERITQAAGVHSDVVFIGYVADQDLPAVYSGADLFVYVSLYEGFGLPPLEAMACGVPVIASKTSSLPEVVGDAGVLVDPTNVHEISDAIVTVLENENLKGQMVKAGLTQASQFSWEESVRRMLTVCEEVKNGHSLS